MRNLLLLFLAAISIISLNAQDFTYNGLTYTVIDEKARTCETKAVNGVRPEIMYQENSRYPQL